MCFKYETMLVSMLDEPCSDVSADAFVDTKVRANAVQKLLRQHSDGLHTCVL